MDIKNRKGVGEAETFELEGIALSHIAFSRLALLKLKTAGDSALRCA